MKLRRIYQWVVELLELFPSHSLEDWEQADLPASSQNTVILLSGFGVGLRSLSVMRRRFLKRGCQVVVFSLASHEWRDILNGFGDYTDKLARLVLQLKKGKSKSTGKVFIVAHSAGGLVARDYIQRRGGFHYCDALVTLGTPHSGTWHAALGFFTPLLLKSKMLWQLLPNSKFLRELNEWQLPVSYPFLSIYSEQDLVCPKAATQFCGWLKMQQPQKEHAVRQVSHTGFLVSERVYKEIETFLLSNNVFTAINSNYISGKPRRIILHEQ